MQKQSQSETLAMREKIYMTVQESVVGAGTGNYNKLKNIPIINLRGESADKCVVLSGLNPGVFNLYGYYKVEESSDVLHQGEPVQLHCVTEDSSIGASASDGPTRRVVYFIHFKNANLYVRMITYYGSEAESDFDICFTQPLLFWEEDGDDHGDDQGGGQNTDPQDPSDPSDPADPQDHADPNDPQDPSDPNTPSDPNDPQDPNTPSDPQDNTGGDGGDDNAGGGDGGDSGDNQNNNNGGQG